jgi:hypothetical protein
MIRPIAIATGGYLSGIARDVLGIATAGHITRRIIPVEPGNFTGAGSDGPADWFREVLMREDLEILRIIQAISEELL